MRLLLIIFSVVLSSSLLAQSLDTPDEDQLEPGRHYRFPAFEAGQLFLTNGEAVSTQLNYNLVTEEIVVELDEVRAPYPTIEIVKKIAIGMKEFSVINKKIYEVLLSGGTTLLVHRKQTVIHLGQQTGLGRTSNQSDFNQTSQVRLQDTPTVYELMLPKEYQLRDVNTYFLQKDEKLVPIRSQKKLLKNFPEISELKSFLKSERINFDSEEDLIKTIEFCNRLHK